MDDVLLGTKANRGGYKVALCPTTIAVCNTPIETWKERVFVANCKNHHYNIFLH